MAEMGGGEPAPTVEIRTFVVPPAASNCYLVRNGQCAALVDAGGVPPSLRQALQEQDLRLEAILLTHAHLDHIAGLDEVRAMAPAPAWVSPKEADWLGDPTRNLSAGWDVPVRVQPAENTYGVDRSVLDAAGLRWTVLETAGHSPGGVSLWVPDISVVFTGDALFKGSIGRTDFPGSDHAGLIEAIRSRLLNLPPQTVVLSGHGPATTIAEEAAINPFL